MIIATSSLMVFYSNLDDVSNLLPPFSAQGESPGKVVVKSGVVNQSSIPWALLLFLGIPGFLILWLLRISSRVFFTNLALFNDAKERVSMINTFLALMEDHEKVKEEDRFLILQAIFRHSSASSNDDAVPQHWISQILHRGGGKPTG